MSELLNVLLADGQRIRDQRTAPPPDQPATRADQIIAAGKRCRAEYRRANPSADTAMVYGEQVGYLEEEIRALDNELCTYSAVCNPALCYFTMRLPDANAAVTVTVGFTYDPGAPASSTSAHTYATTGDPGDPGEPDELNVREVWLNGVDIAVLLCDETAGAIEARVLTRARHEAQRIAQAERMHDQRDMRGASS